MSGLKTKALCTDDPVRGLSLWRMSEPQPRQAQLGHRGLHPRMAYCVIYFALIIELTSSINLRIFIMGNPTLRCCWGGVSTGASWCGFWQFCRRGACDATFSQGDWTHCHSNPMNSASSGDSCSGVTSRFLGHALRRLCSSDCLSQISCGCVCSSCAQGN